MAYAQITYMLGILVFYNNYTVDGQFIGILIWPTVMMSMTKNQNMIYLSSVFSDTMLY